MRPCLRMGAVSLVLSMAFASAVWAQAATTTATTTSTSTATTTTTATALDCSSLSTTDCHQSLTLDPKTIKQCMQRGYDPPLSCRRDNGNGPGVTVGGSRGFGYGTIIAPENSAGAVGANPTVTTDTIRKTMGGVSWTGFPCTIPGGFNICKLDTATGTPSTTPVLASSTNSLCPAKDDTSGLYGVKGTLTGTVPLTCGGSIPLSSYQLTLNRASDHMASTEYGSYYLWGYTQAGTNFALNGGNPLKLPTYLCKAGVKTVDLTAPIAQMILYNASSTSLTLRLMPRTTLDTSTTPAPIPVYNASDPEKYLIVPVVGGIPVPPADCADEATYYKEITSATGEITIESAVNSGCEGSSTACSTATTAPATNQSCSIATLYPTGTVSSVVCDGKTQYSILDRPNLVYAPGSSPTVQTMEGRTAVLTPSLTGSKIYMQTNVILRLGKAAPPLTFDDGATMTLPDGSTLAMSAPVTIDLASGRVTLTGGGQQTNASGVLMSQYAAGASVSVNANVVTLNPTLSLTLPVGYLIPTQPAPYVQIPHDK